MRIFLSQTKCISCYITMHYAQFSLMTEESINIYTSGYPEAITYKSQYNSWHNPKVRLIPITANMTDSIQ